MIQSLPIGTPVFHGIEAVNFTKTFSVGLGAHKSLSEAVLFAEVAHSVGFGEL